MTSSNGNIFRVTSHLCREFTGTPVNSPHKGQWRGTLRFSLICVWINGWVNNREAGDLRRYRAHNNVSVMILGYILGSAYRAVNLCQCIHRGGTGKFSSETVPIIQYIRDSVIFIVLLHCRGSGFLVEHALPAVLIRFEIMISSCNYGM